MRRRARRAGSTSRSRLPAHPKHHPREKASGDQHRCSLEDVLGPALELRADDEQERPGDRADDDGGERAQPDRREPVAATTAVEECEDDADDERGLEALAQHDQA